MSAARARLAWAGIGGAAVLAGVALLVVGAWAMNVPRQRIASQLAVGLTEHEVRERFGEPDRVHHADTAPGDYYLDGWARRERPITSTVWIYVMGEPVCYVWFDDEGRVEDWFVGGS